MAEETVKSLCFFYFLQTRAKAEDIIAVWDEHWVLRDYDMPSEETLENWIEEFKEDAKHLTK